MWMSVESNISKLEKQVGRDYASFPARCWGVVQEVHGRDVKPHEGDSYAVDVVGQLYPGDIAFMCGGAHVGVVANSRRHILHACPGKGLVCEPIIRLNVSFFKRLEPDYLGYR